MFLLQNVGVLPPSTWLGLWRFWPLVLVLVGFELLLGHRGYLAAILGLLVALFALGVALGASQFGVAGGPAITRSDAQSLRGASQATVTLRYGAGRLDVGPLLNAGSDDLSRMNFDGPRDATPEVQYAVSDGIGRLTYEPSGRSGLGFMPFLSGRGPAQPRLGVSLTPNVPLSLSLQTGATEARLDLSRLRVTSLDVSTGAASTWIRLPEAAGNTSVHISGGAASLTLEVPDGVAAQIRHQGGLTTLGVDQNRFPAVDAETYRSPGYDTAQNKIDVTLATGISTVRVS